MAVTAAVKTSDFSGFLPADIAEPIFNRARKSSVVQRMTRQVPLGINGESIPVLTGHPTASWVSEGAIKPASNATMSLTTMSPKKVAVIVPVSQELVRSNPGGFMQVIRDEIGDAIAAAFDAAAFHGTSTPFSAYLDQTTKAVEIGAHTAAEGGAYQDLVSALRLLATDSRALTGFAFDNVVEPALLGSVDGNGRPLFIDVPLSEASPSAPAPFDINQIRVGSTMGRPSYMSPTVATTNKTTVVGYAGDWSQAAWGTIGGIQYTVSTETAVTINGALVSAFENNLVVVRAEAEYGFVVSDVANFVRLTNSVGS